MKVLIVGCGLVGQEVARQLRARGDSVVGTTTTPGKVDSLGQFVDEVVVLRGGDADAMQRAAADVDAIVVTAAPAASRSMTAEERALSYEDVLVRTAESVVAARGDGPVVALSSLSVYGDAADALDVITEEAPLTPADDPSPVNFQRMERTYLDGAPDRACVLRCTDIYGNDDPPLEHKVRMAHQHLGGSVPFAATPLLYRTDVRDVARAIMHAIDGRLTGVYNLVHPDLPPTNGECFDAMSAQLGLPPFTYRAEIVSPSRPISGARFRGTGYDFEHTVVASVPAASAST